MKRTIITLLGLLFVTLWSCKQEPTPDPPAVNYKVTPSGVILAGSSVTIIVSATGADSIFVNDKKLATNNEYIINALMESTTFIATAYGPGGKTTVTINIPVEIPPEPTLTVSYPTEAIAYGDSVTVYWKAEGIITLVTLNGKNVESVDSIISPPIFKDEFYTFVVKGPGGSITKEVKIQSGGWKSSQLGLISYGKWVGVPRVDVLDGNKNFIRVSNAENNLTLDFHNDYSVYIYC